MYAGSTRLFNLVLTNRQANPICETLCPAKSKAMHDARKGFWSLHKIIAKINKAKNYHGMFLQKFFDNSN